ncbi:hypothetical protein BGX28_003000 [Mortierella sp. GBA30]|nr:hypothetical protein BGX28_003000 [Mortierella sp. GBA30]
MNTYNSNIYNDMAAPGIHSRHASTISVLSVPIVDPYYRDLQTLKFDHSALYTELKLTQQTLQLSYKDLAAAKEQSKRAENESSRLRAQMDIILLEIEMGSRRALEQEHIALQQELLRYKLNTKRPPSSSSTSRSPSPTASIRASMFSSFLGGSSRRNRNSQSTGNNNGNGGNIYIPDVLWLQEDETLNSSSSSPRRSLQQKQRQLQQPQHQHGTGAGDLDIKLVEDLDHESLEAIHTRLPTCEQLEVEKLFYEKLREENIAMKLELQDLRHRNMAEKDSIKGYMSLFEGLQKKQSNALAVSQSEIDLLRNALQEHILRLESRESLIQTFAATVNSQAVDLEFLTKEACRERTARARCEQEMASLLEASLLMLERLYSNVDHTFARLQGVMGPIRRSIQHLEIPSITQEWEQCLSMTNKDDVIRGQENNLIFDNNQSQQVFVWRKFMADSFLEECVKSVEKLAQEKRGLQTRIAELTKITMEQDERRRLEEAGCIAATNTEASQTPALVEASSPARSANSNEAEETILVQAQENVPPAAEGSFSAEAKHPDDDDEHNEERCQEATSIDTLRNVTALKDTRVLQLESIMKQIIDWSDIQSSTKQKSLTRDIDDDIVSLGISGIVSEAVPAVIAGEGIEQFEQEEEGPGASLTRSMNGPEGLETLLQLIRQTVLGTEVDRVTPVEVAQKSSTVTVPAISLQPLQPKGQKPSRIHYNGSTELKLLRLCIFPILYDHAPLFLLLFHIFSIHVVICVVFGLLPFHDQSRWSLNTIIPRTERHWWA